MAVGGGPMACILCNPTPVLFVVDDWVIVQNIENPKGILVVSKDHEPALNLLRCRFTLLDTVLKTVDRLGAKDWTLRFGQGANQHVKHFHIHVEFRYGFKYHDSQSPGVGIPGHKGTG